MGLWPIPEKVLLPAQPGGVGTFEFNGRLPNGDQVMAYTQFRYHRPGAMDPPVPRGNVAVLFRFDADGVLKAVDFASVGHKADDPEWSYREARLLLANLVEKVVAEGWVSADILVRPFFVEVDGLATGLIYRTEGKDEENDWEYNEEIRLVPFDIIFCRPWTNGEYST
jgi:hypothetical protein